IIHLELLMKASEYGVDDAVVPIMTCLDQLKKRKGTNQIKLEDTFNALTAYKNYTFFIILELLQEEVGDIIVMESAC
ncbi:10063_t:CDS:2, partial [Funneliformis caledonium]